MDDETFATKTVHVGEDVTLTCSRRSEASALLFWTKLIAGKLPQILGATYAFDSGIVNNTPGFTAKKEPGTFVLHITQTKLSDTAFYYCEETDELQKRYLNVTFLRVKGTVNGTVITLSIVSFKFSEVFLLLIKVCRHCSV